MHVLSKKYFFKNKNKVLEIYKREVLLKKRLLLNPLLVSNVRLAMQLKKKNLYQNAELCLKNVNLSCSTQFFNSVYAQVYFFQWKFINEVSEAENKKFEILPAAEVRFFWGKKESRGRR